MTACKISHCGADDGACTWLIDRIDGRFDDAKADLRLQIADVKADTREQVGAVKEGVQALAKQDERRNGRLRKVERKVTVHSVMLGAIVAGIGLIARWLLS